MVITAVWEVGSSTHATYAIHSVGPYALWLAALPKLSSSFHDRLQIMRTQLSLDGGCHDRLAPPGSDCRLLRCGAAGHRMLYPNWLSHASASGWHSPIVA